MDCQHAGNRLSRRYRLRDTTLIFYSIHMDFDGKTLDKLMHIARLSLNETEKKSFIKDLHNITQWMEHLDAIDTKGVAPLTTLSVEKNNFSTDTPEKALQVTQALANAPQHDGAYFHIPAIGQLKE